MKKIVLTLIAFLAYAYSTHAATSALTESLLEFEAITDYIGAPSFTVIGPNEFIVGINRITRRIDTLGVVKYELCTRELRATTDDGSDDSDNGGRENCYEATLFVAPNPGVGPNIVTVTSIEECRRTETPSNN